MTHKQTKNKRVKLALELLNLLNDFNKSAKQSFYFSYKIEKSVTGNNLNIVCKNVGSTKSLSTIHQIDRLVEIATGCKLSIYVTSIDNIIEVHMI